MALETLSRTKVLAKIDEAKDTNYEVTFIKKDKSVRTMLARQGVEYNLKGGVNKVVKNSNTYISTFDVDKFEYRTVNLQTVTKLIVKGVSYKVVD